MTTSNSDKASVFEQCPPQLASSLLRYELNQKRMSEIVKRDKGSDTSIGIKDIDRELPTKDLFDGGKVVGLGGIEDLHAYALTMLHHLASAHLLRAVRHPQPSSSCPSLFLIEPASSVLSSTDTSLVQIYSLLSQIQQERRNIQLEDLGDQISVLRPFDLIGISQSISEVTDAISNTRQDGDQAKKIVVIRGLSECVFEAFHQDNSVRINGSVTKTAALLSKVLRQIRVLTAKGHKDVLVILDVVGYLAGSKPGTRSGLGIGEGDTSPQQDTQRVGSVHMIEDAAPDLRSAFVSADGSVYKIGLGQRWLEQERENTSRLQQRQSQHQTSTDNSFKPSDIRSRVRRDCNTLAAMLEDMLDACVIVHDGYGITQANTTIGPGQRRVPHPKHIVEVVKDEKGSSQGTWMVWNVDEKTLTTESGS